jgi:multidrug resistance protein, MATE family
MTMNQITAIIKRYPLATFFVLAYAFAWSLVLLTRVSMVFGFMALFGPAAAALIVTACTDGRAGVPGLRVLALTQPFWAVLFVQAGALRGMGNTRFPLLITGTSIWAATGLAFVLIETIGGGLVTIWAAFLVLAPVMAFLMWRRFRRAVAEF